MHYQILPAILDSEGTSFQQIEQRWRPTQLLFLQQVRELLGDMQARYEFVAAAHEELVTLRRPDRYIKLLTTMRLSLREASFQWKADQVRFLRAASQFYSDYGAILRALKFEQARGTFSSRANNEAMKAKEGV